MNLFKSGKKFFSKVVKGISNFADEAINAKPDPYAPTATIVGPVYMSRSLTDKLMGIGDKNKKGER